MKKKKLIYKSSFRLHSNGNILYILSRVTSKKSLSIVYKKKERDNNLRKIKQVLRKTLTRGKHFPFNVLIHAPKLCFDT